tara:strand:- start:465 stop:716 length:252 start_codon:yes stop_codon:yes gene_type:complete
LVISPLYRETVIGAVDIFVAGGIVRRALTGRRSSVVERTIGNGEVESSILSGGTIFPPEIHARPNAPTFPVDAGYRQLSGRLM